MQLNKIPTVVSEKKHGVSVCVFACVQVHVLSRELPTLRKGLSCDITPGSQVSGFILLR